MEHRIGLAVAAAFFAVIGIFIYMNLRNPAQAPSSSFPSGVSPDGAQASKDGAASMAGFENFIDRTERNGMQITAVWLPPIQMEGKLLPEDENIIHLEADILALPGNPNGFSAGAWIPYLPVKYELDPADPGEDTLRGEFLPMVAKDGPHYGATISMPAAGKYRLTYKIGNPGQKGFGRHSDPITGVGEWWEPFEVQFEFNYPGGKSAFNSPTRN